MTEERERYLLLIETDGMAYEAIDVAMSESDAMIKIHQKIMRREPFAVHYVHDLEEFKREFVKLKPGVVPG